MGFFRRRHFAPLAGGRYRLNLDDDERAFLATLPDQIEALLLAAGKPDSAAGTVAGRLFPPAYVSEPGLDAEYPRLMRDELVHRRIEAVGMVRDTVGSAELTLEQLDAWMRVLNDVRLVLGTALDVTEDRDLFDVPDTAADLPQRMVYEFLTTLVDEAVRALGEAR